MNDVYFGKLDGKSPAVGVIMAGGSGTRFWPLSRFQRPKQYLPLSGTDQSLIQATAQRLLPLTSERGILVVTSGAQVDLVKEQLPNVAVLAEPFAKNTAPCVGLAAIRVLADIGDVPMICLPADHRIGSSEALLRVFTQAVEVAKVEDALVTIGILPTAPETGYGYIQKGREVGPGILEVARFVEKPNLETAKNYVDSGEYFWNSGMFVWRPSIVLSEISRQLPDHYAGLMRIATHWKDFPGEDDRDLVTEVYQQFASVSIDYGVMENAKKVLLIPGTDFGWSDVGSWSSWAELESTKADTEGNFVVGDAELVGCHGCFVLAQGDDLGVNKPKLVAGVGLKDLIVVQTPDAILICERDSAQNVKGMVERLQKAGRQELL